MPTFQNIQYHKKARLGFSLIELLVVCTLISFLGTVLYSTFYQGINLWKRSQIDRGEFRHVFFIERLTQDLRNALPLQGHKIRGKATELEFYALMSGSDLGIKQVTSELQFPCRVRYYLNTTTRQIIREIQSYSQILIGSKQLTKTSIVFQGSQKFEWMFMGRNKKATLLWQKTWEKEHLPSAIKINIEYEGQKTVYMHAITIPGGGPREPLPNTL